MDHAPAEKLVFAISIGDLQLNQTSQAKISQKYGFPKTRIQRAMSADPTHKKSGRQYQVEKQKKEESNRKGSRSGGNSEKESKNTARNSVRSIATGSGQSTIRHTC